VAPGQAAFKSEPSHMTHPHLPGTPGHGRVPRLALTYFAVGAPPTHSCCDLPPHPRVQAFDVLFLAAATIPPKKNRPPEFQAPPRPQQFLLDGDASPTGVRPRSVWVSGTLEPPLHEHKLSHSPLWVTPSPHTIAPLFPPVQSKALSVTPFWVGHGWPTDSSLGSSCGGGLPPSRFGSLVAACAWPGRSRIPATISGDCEQGQFVGSASPRVLPHNRTMCLASSLDLWGSLLRRIPISRQGPQLPPFRRFARGRRSRGVFPSLGLTRWGGSKELPVWPAPSPRANPPLPPAPRSDGPWSNASSDYPLCRPHFNCRVSGFSFLFGRQCANFSGPHPPPLVPPSHPPPTLPGPPPCWGPGARRRCPPPPPENNWPPHQHHPPPPPPPPPLRNPTLKRFHTWSALIFGHSGLPRRQSEMPFDPATPQGLVVVPDTLQTSPLWPILGGAWLNVPAISVLGSYPPQCPHQKSVPLPWLP